MSLDQPVGTVLGPVLSAVSMAHTQSPCRGITRSFSRRAKRTKASLLRNTAVTWVVCIYTIGPCQANLRLVKCMLWATHHKPTKRVLLWHGGIYFLEYQEYIQPLMSYLTSARHWQTFKHV